MLREYKSYIKRQSFEKIKISVQEYHNVKIKVKLEKM